MITETYKDISHAPEHYAISNLGNVYSKRKNKIMKTYKNNRGYHCIKLNGIHYTIHRLVATHFVSGYVEGYTVDHIDSNKDNNMFTNLAWVTNKENYDKMVAEGKLNTHTARESLRLEKPVEQLTLLGEVINEFPSLKQAGSETGASASKISLVCSGKRNTTAGYKWRYKNEEDKHTFKTLPQ